MLRLFVSSNMFLVLVLAARADCQPESKSKQFAKDIERLNGTWISPKMEFAPGVTGHFDLKLEFKKDSTLGQATVPTFVSKNGVAVKGPSWTAELKEKEKKRFIVLAETKDNKRKELGEIAYEFNGDKLKLKKSATLQFENGGKPIDLSGEWQRKKAGKKERGEPTA